MPRKNNRRPNLDNGNSEALAARPSTRRGPRPRVSGEKRIPLARVPRAGYWKGTTRATVGTA